MPFSTTFESTAVDNTILQCAIAYRDAISDSTNGYQECPLANALLKNPTQHKLLDFFHPNHVAQYTNPEYLRSFAINLVRAKALNDKKTTLALETLATRATGQPPVNSYWMNCVVTATCESSRLEFKSIPSQGIAQLILENPSASWFYVLEDSDINVPRLLAYAYSRGLKNYVEHSTDEAFDRFKRVELLFQTKYDSFFKASQEIWSPEELLDVLKLQSLVFEQQPDIDINAIEVPYQALLIYRPEECAKLRGLYPLKLLQSHVQDAHRTNDYDQVVQFEFYARAYNPEETIRTILKTIFACEIPGRWAHSCIRWCTNTYPEHCNQEGSKIQSLIRLWTNQNEKHLDTTNTIDRSLHLNYCKQPVVNASVLAAQVLNDWSMLDIEIVTTALEDTSKFEQAWRVQP